MSLSRSVGEGLCGGAKMGIEGLGELAREGGKVAFMDSG